MVSNVGAYVDGRPTPFSIVDTHFTATMETDLDKVGEGQEKWVEVVDRFYKPFEKELTNAEEKIEKIQIKDEPAGFDCELCGFDNLSFVTHRTRHANFFNDRFCIPTIWEITTCIKFSVATQFNHEGQVIERKSKKNRIFYGCSRYPECDFTSWDKPVGRPCPKCGQYLVEKKVKVSYKLNSFY
jgi:DNA topoisomerase-1